MPFSQDIKAQALIAAGRCCCICHKFCGVRIECHHIIPEAQNGSNDLENCIALCFDCHAEVEHYNAQHPKGNKFTPEELRGHRDAWYKKRKETGAFTPDQIIISEDDVIRAFSAIPDFPEAHVRENIEALRTALLKNGVVTRKQLFELVSSAPILNALRRLYIELLLRPLDKPLDPLAVAIWGGILYSYGLRDDIVQEIGWQLRQSPEYKKKHNLP
jgi:hypothetical protein